MKNLLCENCCHFIMMGLLHLEYLPHVGPKEVMTKSIRNILFVFLLKTLQTSSTALDPLGLVWNFQLCIRNEG